MKISIWIVVLFLFFQYGETAGQIKKWTLQECIDYAVNHNIDLKRQRLQTETAQANFLKSRMNVMPTLNAGSDARIGFGRSVDPVTNLITFKQNLSNSYALSSSLELFKGFNTLNTIAANRFMLKAGLEEEKVICNALVVKIMEQYYQVLYSKGLEQVSKQQLDLSVKQLFRIQKLVETGREALAKQYEMESRVSADKLASTVAQNTASQALTSLRQMLQLEPGTDFDILMPESETILLSDKQWSIDSIFTIASQTLPRLKAIEFELRASEKQVNAAKGFLTPSLSIGGTIYTGYYNIINEETSEKMSFVSQMKNNNSQAIFLSLDIPLFNNFSTRTNINLAKIKKMDTWLRLEQEKNDLYTEIENACLNYNRGKDEYLAAADNLKFNRKSFFTVEKKFESGIVDVTDFSSAKNTLYSAETEALRTRLQLMIRELMILFYTTGDYENLFNN